MTTAPRHAGTRDRYIWDSSAPAAGEEPGAEPAGATDCGEWQNKRFKAGDTVCGRGWWRTDSHFDEDSPRLWFAKVSSVDHEAEALAGIQPPGHELTAPS